MRLALEVQVREGKVLSTDKNIKWKRFAFYDRYQERYEQLKKTIQANLDEGFELLKKTTNQAYLYSEKLNKTFIIKI